MVRGKVAEILGKVPVGTAPAEAPVPLFIRGSSAKPIVIPDLKRLALNTGKNYLDQVLKGKLPEPVKDVIPGKVGDQINKQLEKWTGKIPGFQLPGQRK